MEKFQSGQRVRCASVPDPMPDTPERAHIFEAYGPMAEDCSVLRLLDGMPVCTPRKRYMVKVATVRAIAEGR